MLGDGRPVVHRGAAHRVRSDAHAGVLDGRHVHDVRQVRNVVVHVVVLHAALIEHAVDRHALYTLEPGAQVVVGLCRNPIGGIGIRRAACRRVVLESTIARRVVGGGNHDAVGARVGQDGVGDGRGRGIAAAVIHPNLQFIGKEDLEGGDHGGFGQGVSITADEDGARGALLGAVVHDGLGDGQDVGLVEGGVQGGAAVPRGAEGNLLVRVIGVGGAGVVRGDQLRDIDEIRRLG